MIFAEFQDVSFFNSWLSRMFAATWQGGLFLVVAFAICGYWKSLPAVTRCWIWRLAYAKFLLILLFGCLINIPVLPNRTAQSNKSASHAEPLNMTHAPAVVAMSTSPLGGNSASDIIADRNGESTASSEKTVSAKNIEQKSLSWLPWLFGAWLAICLSNLVFVFVQYFRATKFAREGLPVGHGGFLHEYQKLCYRLRIRNKPPVRISRRVGSPMLVGAIRPVILLPESVIRSCDNDELKLILAHELAHAKRRDLLWNWLPTIVKSIFFFHPLVWLAQSRFGLDQEIACDYLALTSSQGRNSTYGNTLIKLASNHSNDRIPRLAAIGVASSFKTLRKRITEMGEYSKQQSQGIKWLSVALLIGGLIAAAPIDLVAQKETTKQEKNKTKVKKKAKDTGLDTLPEETRNETKIKKTEKLLKKDPKSPLTKSDSKKKVSNLSVSVSEDGVTRSLRVKSRTNGTVEIAFTKEEDGDKKIQKYVLGDFEKLAEKNKEAYDFYKEHVGDAKVKNKASSSSDLLGQLGKKGFQGLPKKGQFNSDQSGNSSSQSSSSSAWESSATISRNGVTKTTRDSGVTGTGAVGGGNPQMVIDQINKMIDKTDDPKMKDQLRKMIQMIKNR